MVDKVLTANRLSDGIAVWLDANGEWNEDLQSSLVARHAEAVASLERSESAISPPTRLWTSTLST